MASPETNLTQTTSDELGWPGTDFDTERELSVMYGHLIKDRAQRERAELEHVDWPVVI